MIFLWSGSCTTDENWPFGHWYCTVSNFIANATVAASVFTLTGISCDRYLAIVHPLHPRMSRASSLFTITLIWTASMLLALPCLLYSRIVFYGTNSNQRAGCILVWPDEKLYGSAYDLWYQMVFLLTTYIVPILLMSLSYAVMGTVLWGSRSIGEKTQRQVDSIRSKRKVVKMFLLVVTIFGICWLPYHSYFIYVYFDTKILFSRYTQHVFLGFYWFAMSNAMVNPLIYYWMNASCLSCSQKTDITLKSCSQKTNTKREDMFRRINPSSSANHEFRKYFKSAIFGWVKYIQNRNSSNESPPNDDIRSHSYSRSGAEGTMRVRVTSPRDREYRYQNGNALQHYTQISRANVNGEDSDSMKSRKWSSRSRSWKRQNTTDL